MNFFAVFVRKLEPFAKLERTLPPFLGRFAAGAFFVTVSCVICEYHVYKEVWNPSIGERSCTS